MTRRDEVKDLLHDDEVEPEALEEEEPAPGALDEEDLLEVLEDELVDDEPADEAVEEPAEELEAAPDVVAVVEDEDEEEVDVEESLDDILRAKLTAAGDEDEGEDEDEVLTAPVYVADDEELHPHGRDEFVCQVCFVIHHRRMLADADKMVCVDCV